MISIIVAIDGKRGIGKNNDLLFRIPEDFEKMKNLTNGHPLVMGRKTFESIGRVLPNRTNIIISQNAKLKIQNATVVNSLKDGIKVAKKSLGSDEIFIFGGGQIFKQALEQNLVDRLYLTMVEGDFGADTFFPDYANFAKVISEEEHESSAHKFKFLTLEK